MNVETQIETRDEMFEASKKAAAGMAASLNMRPIDDIRNLTKDNLAIIVSKDGIQTGIITMTRMPISKYNDYLLNGVVLYREHYYLGQSGLDETGSISISVPEDAVIYRGV